MDRDHWRMVPPKLQAAVWAAYDNGRGVDPQTRLPLPPLAEAQMAAIIAVETRLGLPPRPGLTAS
jgi:hypothetical protein